MDRSGKGMRTSPRDALIADSCPECERGRAFGFHRAMDTSGAVAGPLLAFFLFSKAGMNYRSIFLISVVPAIVAVLLVLMVREKRWIGAGVQNLQDKSVNEKLPADFKKFLFVLGLFTLGNSSDAFLILRANNVGVSPMFIPILWLTFNSTYAVSSLPSGIASDRIGSKRVITYGFLIYALVYFGFAFASFQYQAWLFFIIYGFYYGLTDGVSRSFVSKMILPQHRATAFGIYHAVVGLIALPASLLMGFLWDWRGPRIAFMFGMSLALISALLLATFNLKEK
ncbi:MFS transporter [Candidatus Desantisbacteria bacterium CG_4_10_14_0_8_um_filter_39_17]|uniref:MFS transporter n=1 Tax=Candidatus Desantisbacteria bacterium CG_4_10_14_0_8_um_filter_39_17 TaxID=1974542 RepID=A0A2H9PAY7_9BACT|nr:MAG: MFS transporter [Candidatus Desantisbacteria bacterium CG_4_10_14_0_8_um_filter_39_17]